MRFAHKAIDGGPATEWSSNGDGKKAWIEIALAQESKITGIGFWTRTMGTSAQISKFRVLTKDGKILDVFREIAIYVKSALAFIQET